MNHDGIVNNKKRSFSKEVKIDKILIKALRDEKRYGAKKVARFQNSVTLRAVHLLQPVTVFW